MGAPPLWGDFRVCGGNTREPRGDEEGEACKTSCHGADALRQQATSGSPGPGDVRTPHGRRRSRAAMPETIVCGVDQSDAAESVADSVRWLASRLGARLVLLHVAEEPMQEAEELVSSIRVRLSLGARDEILLVEGSPQDRLLAAVEQDGADLLVVGSRGRGAIRSALFGSVSRSLVTMTNSLSPP